MTFRQSAGLAPKRRVHEFFRNVEVGDIQRSQTIDDPIASLDWRRNKTVRQASGRWPALATVAA
jgi:hypothetical protein